MTIEEHYEALEPANEKQSRFLSPLRYTIVVSQLGDIARRISHDEEVNVDDDLNPVEPRPFASHEEEVRMFGHTYANLLMLAMNRDIEPEELQDGIDHAIESLTDKDWKASEAAEDGSIQGIVANDVWNGEVSETIEGVATDRQGAGFCNSEEHVGILVVEHFRPEDTPLIDNVIGIVTDHGGLTSHAANLARERGVPCVVDTGNVTEQVEPGNSILVNLNTGEVEVRE